ncbi:hypothetical protein GGS26DRAFT_592612 [Hypomontagnella submonticulosa]|nr:hypothetical protein GGS26DRAFT_592612 [Hypomontagnella submonticulosa]
MYAKSLLVAFLLSAFVTGNPMPKNPKKNQPITDAEWKALKEGGLKARAPKTSVNVPITDAEMKALRDLGLDTTSSGLMTRDYKMNCGHLVTGSGGSNGHGKWIPVKQFSQVAEEFCNAYEGTDIAKGHETSDTYGISLTNQDDDSKAGPSGNIVFAIYNTEKSSTYLVDKNTCLTAMKAPLGSHAVKRDDGEEYIRLGKRDDCWGKKHNDYEGGYWKVSDVGAFGSEVYAA